MEKLTYVLSLYAGMIVDFNLPSLTINTFDINFYLSKPLWVPFRSYQRSRVRKLRQAKAKTPLAASTGWIQLGLQRQFWFIAT